MKENPQKQKVNGNRILLEKDTFRFECHPGVACFTRCCRNADMYLYPYDIIRMKERLGISSDEFLKKHTIFYRQSPTLFRPYGVARMDSQGVDRRSAASTI